MDFIRDILKNEEYQVWVGMFFFLISSLVMYLVYKYALRILKKQLPGQKH